jgi:peptidoglycan hydrolase-like protein with peptidoglycan-binding domain/3D (Asp-Asp-Asp) domain-containing protein
MKTKIILLASVVAFSWFGWSTFFVKAGTDLSACTKQTFRVTAYYSPKKEQRYFFQGDFEAETTLNGKGTHGASGAPVFNGMIAAPKSYSFGTQVIFPGFGIGQVEDRGGAIVQKGERGEVYDRIDIWLGEGEEGLKRAISFGVGYMEGYVCPEWTTKKVWWDLKAFPIDPNFFFNSLWIINLGDDRKDPWVWMVQRLLAQLGYYTEEEYSSTYDDLTKQAVCSFQQDRLWLDQWSIWCGYFGPQTRGTLMRALKKKGIYESFLQKNTDELVLASMEESTSIVEDEPLFPVEPTHAVAPESPPQAPAPIVAPEEVDPQLNQKNAHYLSIGDTRAYQFLENIALGTANREVKMLQRKLQWLGFYTDPISGIYDTTTAQAVYAFQLHHKLLTGDENPKLFGYFGPATRAKLNSL